MFKVTCGVHGSFNVIEREYETEAEARAKALRWSRSNSIGSYWSQAHTPDGQLIGQYN